MSLIRSPSHFPFELGEGQQHIEGETAHARRGVKTLRHRDKGHFVRIEDFDQFGKVGQRAGEPVDLIDHDHVDPVLSEIDEQFLERGTLHAAAGKASIVIALAMELPAFMGLALDIGFGRFTLGMKRIEVLLEP